MLEQTNQIQRVAEPVLQAYRPVRQASLDLCAHLELEDYGLQAMPEVSPPKWHLAHTSWFFETFLLKPFAEPYQPFHPQFEYLFNSYYNAIGRQYPRPQRGLLSRPTLSEVLAYRDAVDRAMHELLARPDHPQRETLLRRCELGLHHEQQHQELLCTDIKYSFSKNPLYPALGTPPLAEPQAAPGPLVWHNFEAAEVSIGYAGNGFHFDNEGPAHAFRQPAFQFAHRLVSNAEYRAFIEDGGYSNPALWLADGWTWIQETGARQPLYWIGQDGAWQTYTLYGLRPLDPNLPLAHVNFYEADAYARWCGKRLPTEQEWETACRCSATLPTHAPVRLHPRPSDPASDGLQQMFGAAWQWTCSAYAPYPGYRPASGAIGEYNGKFMCNQIVLRGSSCVTPPGHARPSYRNFFYPRDQWQFSGIRLAADAD